ncbi:Uma2 family endonuclease [Embleya sp. NBC_00888]|uniref:Uma2 family endonuclease n=1 Tax=Embleya sp. NBC_00888 TaxID=2975960 RepID=UPI00386C3842|nr:Uma2 family endonuclease [Embleya sp. NBC_00888]
MTTIPEWMYPPNPGGWTADDMDSLSPDAPRHTELIDGALVFMMSPRRSFHGRVMGRLWQALDEQAPLGFVVEMEMAVKLGKRDRPEPDVLIAKVPYDADRTHHVAANVVLAVEIVSDESEERDRETKPLKYAKAGIPHFRRIEEENKLPVVHVFELEPTTGAYVATAIERVRLDLPVPFAIDIDVASLVR